MIEVYIPTYNENEKLMKSVKSVKDISITIVDNNSENSYVLNELGKKNNVIINSKNYGRVGNWEQSVKHFNKSNSNWMKWLFVGDVLYEHAKEKMEKAIKEFPKAKMIIFNYDIKDGENIYSHEIFKESKLIYPEEGLIKAAISGNWFGAPIAYLINKDAIKENYEFGSIPWVADFQFALNIMAKYPVAYVNEKIGLFCVDYRKYYKYYVNNIWSYIEEYAVRKRALELYKGLLNYNENKYLVTEKHLENKLKDIVAMYFLRKSNEEKLADYMYIRLNIINEKFEEYKEVKCLIWGAGTAGKVLSNQLIKSNINYNIIAYIDSFKEGMVDNIEIIKPERLKLFEYDYIFIATEPGRHFAEEYLNKMKLVKLNDYICMI